MPKGIPNKKAPEKKFLCLSRKTEDGRDLDDIILSETGFQDLLNEYYEKGWEFMEIDKLIGENFWVVFRRRDDEGVSGKKKDT